MLKKVYNLPTKNAEGYVKSLGKFNLVWIQTDTGLLGCGAFDVAALDKFEYPAARVKSADGGPITVTDDLLKGIVRDVNDAAQKRGISVGMSGEEALTLL